MKKILGGHYERHEDFIYFSDEGFCDNGTASMVSVRIAYLYGLPPKRNRSIDLWWLFAHREYVQYLRIFIKA